MLIHLHQPDHNKHYDKDQKYNHRPFENFIFTNEEINNRANNHDEQQQFWDSYSHHERKDESRHKNSLAEYFPILIQNPDRLMRREIELTWHH
jgi:hypothetical protein